MKFFIIFLIFYFLKDDKPNKSEYKKSIFYSKMKNNEIYYIENFLKDLRNLLNLLINIIINPLIFFIYIITFFIVFLWINWSVIIFFVSIFWNFEIKYNNFFVKFFFKIQYLYAKLIKKKILTLINRKTLIILMNRFLYSFLFFPIRIFYIVEILFEIILNQIQNEKSIRVKIINIKKSLEEKIDLIINEIVQSIQSK